MLNYDEKRTIKLKERLKGNSLLTFPDDYTVIDLETNGTSPENDDIIEVSAIKVRSDEIVDTYTRLIKPEQKLKEYITSLTGITEMMLQNELPVQEVLPEYINFIGKDIILGHNVNFDINFVYDKSLKHFNTPVINDYVDTLKIARKIKPKTKDNKLKTLAEYYSVKIGKMHRGLEDCRITYEVYKCMKSYSLAKIAEFM